MTSILESILSPLSVSQFLKDFSYKKAVHIEGQIDKFSHLFGWNEFNEVLATLTLTKQEVKLSKGGKNYFSNNVDVISDDTRNGATVIVENLDNYDPSIRKFLNKISDEICTLTRTNLYLSFPNVQGYNLHYDTHDFFILQLEGYKEWNVYPKTVESPLFYQKYHGTDAPSKEEIYLNCILKKGDVLYVPKGHWHEALSINEPSMHLTLAMFSPTGIDFLNWFVNELRDDAEIRSSLPFILKEDFQENGISIHKTNDFLNLVKDRVKLKLDEIGTAGRFYQHYTVSSKNRVPFTFPDQIIKNRDTIGEVSSFKKVPQSTLLLDRNDKKIELIYSGKSIKLSNFARNVIEFILENDEFTKDQLQTIEPNLSLDQIHNILFVLLQERLIVTFKE